VLTTRPVFDRAAAALDAFAEERAAGPRGADGRSDKRVELVLADGSACEPYEPQVRNVMAGKRPSKLPTQGEYRSR
jgi:hypothetical protein